MEKWDNEVKFIFTTLGTSIGFGAVWRFSYNLYTNGGAVFLFLNIFFLLLIGIPYSYFELSIGQYYKKNLFTLYSDISKKYWGLAFSQLILLFFISINFVSIISYCLIYLKYSLFSYELPFYSENNKEILYKANSFFYNEILKYKRVDEPGIFGSISAQNLISLILVWIIVYLIIYKGINNSGSIAILTVTLPYFLFIVLLIKGLLLPGSFSGIKELLIPDFSKLLDYKIWLHSLSQVVFQLCLGFQISLFFSTRRKTKNKQLKATFIITIANFLTGIFFGFIIYLFLGYYSNLLNVPIHKLPISGPDLVFITIPSILSTFMFSNIWIALFSISFILVGIDSIFSSFDCFYYTLINCFEYYNIFSYFLKINNSWKKLFILLILFLFSILLSTEKGFNLFLAIDSYIFTTLSWLTMIFSLYIFIFKENKFENISNYLSFKNKEKIPKFLLFCLKYLNLPFCLILLIFQIFYIFFENHIYGYFLYIIYVFILLFIIINAFYFIYYYNQKENYDKKEKVIHIKEILLRNLN